MKQDMLERIIDWAQKEALIQALILNGSLAGRGPTDELSDYDIAVFTTDTEKYTSGDSWIDDIADVWVYEPCAMRKNNTEYQTRLIIYKGGVQVDFALYDMAYLEYLTQCAVLPVDFNLGYRVLLDKNNVTKDLKQATYVYPMVPKPSFETFDRLIKNFFFETFKGAKALCRNDLWHVKLRDWTTKEYLLTMIEWHAKVHKEWNYDTNCAGKRMEDWVDPAIWERLQDVFAHFEADDSWKALMATVDFFRMVAAQTAERLGYQYPMSVDENITMFLHTIKEAYEQKTPI